MLILQRKLGESLLIGDNIQVTVVSIDSGGRVRLAIDAPKTYAILRSELLGAANVNREAAQEELAPLELLSFLDDMMGNNQS